MNRILGDPKKSTVRSTCIHVSSICRSGDVSGEEIAGGKGWMSFGTTTRSLPKTRIAPALFAVPDDSGESQTWDAKSFEELKAA